MSGMRPGYQCEPGERLIPVSMPVQLLGTEQAHVIGMYGCFRATMLYYRSK